MARLRRMLPMPRFLLGKPRARFALERFVELAGELGLTGACIDIGCAAGHHLQFIKERGPFGEVHGLDLPRRGPPSADRYFSTPLEKFEAKLRYDGIWCSHTLEHSANPGIFLGRIKGIASDKALICITVPPLRHDNTIGHLTMWNAGTLLLNLVKVGFDCSQARVRRSGYNISVILQNSLPSAGGELDAPRSQLEIQQRMPEGIVWRRSVRGVSYFNGKIRRMNWS